MDEQEGTRGRRDTILNGQATTTATTIARQNASLSYGRPKQDYLNVAYANVATSTSNNNNNDHISDASLMRTCEHNNLRQLSASRPPAMLFQLNKSNRNEALEEAATDRRKRRNSLSCQPNGAYHDPNVGQKHHIDSCYSFRSNSLAAKTHNSLFNTYSNYCQN